MSEAALPTVLLAGNPNAGKTSIFNRLTGARAKVGNYPGVTVERRSATAELRAGARVEIVDLPGTYSLASRSADERVAEDAILGRGGAPPAAVVVVSDATSLRRGLYLATQVIDVGRPVVLALNMIDEAESLGLAIDADALGEALGCRVVATVATRGRGLDGLRAAIADAAKDGAAGRGGAPPPALPGDLAQLLAPVEQAARDGKLGATDGEVRSAALWAALSLGDDDEHDVPEGLRRAVDGARAAAQARAIDLDEALVAWRYQRVDEALARTSGKGAPEAARRHVGSDRADAVLLHPVAGLVVFAVVMLVVFQALFAWSEPLVAGIEEAVAWAQGAARGALPEGALRDLLVDGAIAGVGNVVVFVPQIAILFAFITVMEDSGYLSRVAFVIDRVMRGVGLHGRAFVPMLSGFACAIPAVMATRTLESRRDRLLTMLVVPLASCSARLPVYVLVTATVFDPEARVLGVLSLGAAVLFAMYALSATSALAAAAVLRRTVLRGPRPTLVMELPPYRLPSARDVLLATWQRVRRFLTDAGTVILALSIVMWGLLTYPKGESDAARWEARRAEIAAAATDEAARAEALEAATQAEAGEALRASAGGRLGQLIEPVVEPLGFDWRIGVGIIGAFAAREVFVSTLGIVFDVGSADEESAPLRQAMRDAKHRDGTRLMTPLAGVSLMVFFVLACQCMSTVAVVRRESGSWRWAGLMVAYMTALAYGASLLVYQVGRALGWGLT